MNQPQNDFIDVQVEPSGPRELAVSAQNNFMPLLTGQEAQRRIEAIKDFVRNQMVRDLDYGPIPGTNNKPVLLKPGAEKLCTLFGLRAQLRVASKIEDWDRPFLNYHYTCRLYRGDLCIAEADGACNSMEKKFRWRSVSEYKATPEDKERAVRREERKGNNGSYTVLILENDDIYSLANTIMKMGEKRAFVAATLIAVNASDYFTQDLEENAEPQPEPQRPQRKSEQQRQAPVQDDLAEQAREADRREKAEQEREQEGNPRVDWSRAHAKGTLANVYVDKKQNDKGPYTKYSAYLNRVAYSTFSDSIGSVLEKAKASNTPVVIFYQAKGNFKNITEVISGAEFGGKL